MDELALNVNEAIKSSECYKRYLAYKTMVENDCGLIELRNEMDQFKKLNCKNKNDKYIQDYYELEKKYYDNLKVKAYEKSKDELYALLKEISDILSLN